MKFTTNCALSFWVTPMQKKKSSTVSWKIVKLVVIKIQTMVLTTLDHWVWTFNVYKFTCTDANNEAFLGTDEGESVTRI